MTATIINIEGQVLEQGLPFKLDAYGVLARDIELPRDHQHAAIDWTVRATGADLSRTPKPWVPVAMRSGLRSLSGRVAIDGSMSLVNNRSLKQFDLVGHISGDLDLRGTLVRKIGPDLVVGGEIFYPDTGELVVGAGRTGVRGALNCYFGALFGATMVRDGAGMVKMAYRAATKPEGEGRVETFDEAVERLKLHDEALEKRAFQLQVQVLIALGLALIITTQMGFNFSKPQDFLARLNTFAFVPVITMFLALAHRWAFRHWQIRQRRLGGLVEFNCSPRQWWPRRFSTRQG